MQKVNDLAPKGLDGVVVDVTQVADVQPGGVLSYRGKAIDDLVSLPFEEVASLLLGSRVDACMAALLPHEQDWILALDRSLHPMRVLQAIVPVLTLPKESDLTRGMALAAKLPTVIATHHRGAAIDIRAANFAESFLSAFNDVTVAAVDPDHAAAFNTAQILQLEHSFNAGTFAARVVASTLADVTAAVAAGFGALSGALHGGADQQALETVDQLETPTEIEAFVDQLLARGGRLPGMGHREYRVRDPRALHLEEWAGKLAHGTRHAQTFDKLKFLEETFRQRMQSRGKPVYANVEFYKGLVYRIIGLPDDYFTAGFALARVYGYVAHFVESRQDNRIYRPKARYVGANAL